MEDGVVPGWLWYVLVWDCNCELQTGRDLMPKLILMVVARAFDDVGCFSRYSTIVRYRPVLLKYCYCPLSCVFLVMAWIVFVSWLVGWHSILR